MRRTVALLALAGLGAVAEAAPPQPAAAREEKPASPAGYRIGPEDVLQIVVWKNESLTHTVPVRPDGKISLPLLNDVQAADLTPLQLREELVKRLTEYMPTPEVSVIVTEVRSFKVSVMGHVAKPGRYELGGATTVVDALAMAGGFTEFASRSRVVVLRRDGRNLRRLPFDYDKLRSAEAMNFRLLPGDVVLVP